jgi:transcriptional regulator with XRE-family HTH domain
MTQEQLADLLNSSGIQMSGTQLARLEKGSRSLRAIEAVALADILGCSVNTLLGYRDRPEADRVVALQRLLEVIVHGQTAAGAAVRDLSERAADVGEMDDGMLTDTLTGVATACDHLTYGAALLAQHGAVIADAARVRRPAFLVGGGVLTGGVEKVDGTGD